MQELPRRALRMPDELWHEARKAAFHANMSTSEWIREAMRQKLDAAEQEKADVGA